MYVCLLDASKVIDRVHYGKLVKFLRDRKVPAVILRLLFNSYTHQTLCTSWTGYLARPIQTLNGVK